MTKGGSRPTRKGEDFVSERDFQRQIIELARLCGWRIHHTRAAMNRRGRWSAPIQGDAGFPDLVLVRNGACIFAELKRVGAKVTALQQQWLDALAEISFSVEVYVWRPTDWRAIEDTLR